MIRIVKFAIAALALTAPFAAQARVAATSPAKQEAVRYADLDLTREASAQVLVARLHAAAAHVCGPAPSATDLGFQAIYKNCLHETMERSVAAVNSPLVAKVYTGSSVQTLAQN